MKIISYNVNGIRAALKKDFVGWLKAANPEVVCLQETKAEESQVMLPDELLSMYPYRYWNSTDGKTQRKGLSGTTIWCRSQPIKVFENADFDKNTVLPHGQCGHVALSTFWKHDLQMPFSRQTLKHLYNPKYNKSKMSQFKPNTSILSCFDIIWYSLIHLIYFDTLAMWSYTLSNKYLLSVVGQLCFDCL